MRAGGRTILVGPATFEPRTDATGAAARNKLVAMARAVRAAGGRPLVVTIQPSARIVAHRDGVGFVAVPAAGRRAFRRVVGMVVLALFALRRVRPEDRVILYNAFPEYLLLALLLRLRSTPATLDVEDAPIGARTARERVQLWVYVRIAALTRPGKIVASRMLAQRLGLERVLPVYGMAAVPAPIERFANEDVLVQFGGSLLPETGIDLFRAAVETIAREAPASRLRFVVTGVPAAGALAGMPAIASVVSTLDDTAYRALLDRVDVGLSLKLPDSEMGQTTFPSKTIELAAAGLLLVTTRVSDVPAIFDESCAVLLPAPTPRALADALLAIEADRDGGRRRAAAGQARVVARFAPAAVGAAITAFVA